jgi:signal transduction histidine kinase
MLKSLQARLTLSYVAVILICLALVGGAALLLLRGYQRNLVFGRLSDLSHFASRTAGDALRRGAEPAQVVRLLHQRANAEGRPAVMVYLLDADGQVLAGSNDRLDTTRAAQLNLPGAGTAAVTRGEWRLGPVERMLYVAEVVQPGPGMPHRIQIIATPHRPGFAIVGDLVSRLAWAGGIALGISLLLAALVAYSVARPLDRIARAAEEIAGGNYDQQLDISAPDEVARLAASFNTMSRQVKDTLQAQQDLVANVSHELKTPLTSIRGFSQALIDGAAADDAARARAATVIHDEAGRMRRLVDELLDLARLEAGQVSLAREPVDVGWLLRDCAARFAPRAREMGVTLTVDVPPALPVVQGDADRLGQVFGNLVDNALKHAGTAASPGQVTLLAEPREGRVVCAVTDNGPGIPPNDLPRVFERFYQVDKSRARREVGSGPGSSRGAGLGLAIAREIVHAHGGRIRAESVEGLGSRFMVELAAAVGHAPAEAKVLGRVRAWQR